MDESLGHDDVMPDIRDNEDATNANITYINNPIPVIKFLEVYLPISILKEY